MISVSKVNYNRPDVNYANRLKAIFIDDSEIVIDIDAEKESNCYMTFTVTNPVKAAALRKIIKPEYDIGNLKLFVDIKDAESEVDGTTIINAFTGNPHCNEYRTVVNPITGQEYHLCIFNKEVIQFPNDNGGSLHGYETRVMEDLAREVLEVPTLLYSTDDGIVD